MALHEQSARYLTRLLRFKTTTPLVLAALPDYGSLPLSARQITEKGRCGATSTVRNVLNSAVRLNIAHVTEIPIPQGTLRVYTRAPSIHPDNFESSPNVYPEEQEAEGVE